VVKRDREDLGFCVVEQDGLSVYKDEDTCCPNTMAIDIERWRLVQLSLRFFLGNDVLCF